jgi:hypothetical protein
MSDERKIFLYFLTDAQGRSYYYENGVVKKSSAPYPLDKSPGGWIDQAVSFGRSSKYYGLNRTFTHPFKFVDDGATIIRTLFYTKKGIEEKLNLIINKWNPDTDIYDPYYKGEIDLTKIEDLAAEGVNVNVIEGGIVKLLKSFETTLYEFPCDGTIPENKLVRMDGIQFNDTFRYSTIGFEKDWSAYTIPLVFLSNDGYNANATNGDQESADVNDVTAYVTSSSNYFYKYFGSTSIRVRGSFTVRNKRRIVNLRLSIITSKNVVRDLYNGALNGGQLLTIPVDTTFTVSDEALFLIAQVSGPFGAEPLEFSETTFSIEFTSRYTSTDIWAISARDLWTLIVNKIGGGYYLADSTLLTNYPNLFITSGDAIRGADGSVIKTTLSDFFSAINVFLNASLSNQKLPGQAESLFLEDKEYVFDSSVVTLDIGEVSEFKVGVALDYFFNSMNVGYQAQTYDEKAGRQEFNTTAVYSAPITKLKKEFSLISPYRADPFGIEFTRVNSPGKSTTKNASDNAVFALNVNSQPTPQSFFAQRNTNYEVAQIFEQPLSYEFFSGSNFTPDFSNQVFTYTYGIALDYSIFVSIYGNLVNFNAPTDEVHVLLYQNSTLLEERIWNQTGSSFFEFQFDKQVVLQQNDTITVKMYVRITDISGSATVTEAGLSFLSTSLNVYSLLRENYDEITGIDNPASLFNIELFTPARLVRKHGNYLRAVLHNLPDESLTFQTLSKNKELVTRKNGVTIMEKADIRIGSLDAPLFYPYTVSCKTQVPLNFMEVFEGAANGHIRFTYNGKTFYGFPIDVSVKPALNDAQEWKMLISPRTNLADLVDLDVDGLNYNIMAQYGMSVPHLCPVQFVPLNPILNARYHFVQMDDNWFANQVKFYIGEADYYQKFQLNDTANIQVRTNGIGPVRMDLYNCDGEIVRTVNLDQIETAAVVSPNVLFEGTMNFLELEEGVYAIVLTAGTGSTLVQFISEKIYLKQDWPMTLLFEYTNNRNKQSTIFSTGYNPSMRVEGWIGDFEPGSKFATYEDQPADMQLLNGIPFRKYKLNIGVNDGVPPWLIDKINRIMLLTDTSIDGLAYTRNADAQFEKIDVPGWPMKYWTLEIREASNRDTVTLNTDGELNSDLTVVYNINTKAFGDGSEDNIVQVTEID